MSTDTNAHRCAAVCARFNASPYWRHLGLEAESAAPGCARVTMRFQEALTQAYGDVHGGALLSLADAAVNIALATTFQGREVTATVELSMQFMAPAGRNDIVAHGSVSHRGGRLAFCACVLATEAREIARAQGVCYVAQP